MSGNIYVPPEEFIVGREHQLPPDQRPLVADMAFAGARFSDAQRAPLGEPGLDFDVRSIYDSRPINGQDFIISATSIEPGAVTTITLSMQVPQGYVAVLRRIFVNLDPPPPFTLLSDVLATVLRQGAAVPYLERIAIGLEADILQPMFVISDENTTLAVRLDFSAAIGTDVSIEANFYGNFLAKTNRPPAFEIANPAGHSPPARVAPAPPPPPPPPVQQQPAQLPPSVMTPTPRVTLPVAPRRRVTFATKG